MRDLYHDNTMTNLYLFYETFTNGLYYDTLTVISFFSVLCGILVITVKNPIVSVLYLIGLFLSIAIYLMMLGIHFIGLSYLLVYVGAVSILFLFILMLINVRISELVTDNNNSIPLAIVIGAIFSTTLYHLFPSESIFTSSRPFSSLSFYKTDHLVKNSGEVSLFKEELIKGQELSFVTSSTWDGSLTEFSHITSIGNILYTVYPMWLILTSLILLLAMVGAIVITIKQ